MEFDFAGSPIITETLAGCRAEEDVELMLYPCSPHAHAIAISMKILSIIVAEYSRRALLTTCRETFEIRWGQTLMFYNNVSSVADIGAPRLKRT